jgi:hypothetical protein
MGGQRERERGRLIGCAKVKNSVDQIGKSSPQRTRRTQRVFECGGAWLGEGPTWIRITMGAQVLRKRRDLGHPHFVFYLERRMGKFRRQANISTANSAARAEVKENLSERMAKEPQV